MLCACRLHPNAADIEMINHWAEQVSDWPSFTESVIKNGLGPLIHKNLPLLNLYGDIPERCISDLRQIYFKTLSRNMVLYAHFRSVVDALAENEIMVIPLKGIYLAEAVYKDIGLRQMSDIDLLVRESDILRSKEILIGLGYKQNLNYLTSGALQWFFGMKHLPGLILNGVCFEIHSRLHASRRRYRFSLREIINRSQQDSFLSTSCFTFSTVDLILHLCIHLFEHIHTPHYQLYRYCDIAETLRNAGPDFDWDELMRLAKSYHCDREVRSILFLVNKYFNAPVPEKIIGNTDQSFYKKIQQTFISRIKISPSGFSNEGPEIKIRGLKKSKGLMLDLRVFAGLTFPDISYMKSRYRVKSSIRVLPFYLVRVGKGFQYLFRILHRSTFPRN